MAPVDLGSVQAARKTTLKLLALLALFTLIIAGSRWNHTVHRIMEAVGTCLIVICVMGRTLCAIYISGNKGVQVVETGPYSVCRNPLYVFSFLGVVGVGLMSGSIVISLLFAGVVFFVQKITVSKEETFLLARHGAHYKAYVARVPQFWPNFSLWNSGDILKVRTHGVIRTFGDALLFFLAIPAMELLETMKETGWMPVLFELP